MKKNIIIHQLLQNSVLYTAEILVIKEYLLLRNPLFHSNQLMGAGSLTFPVAFLSIPQADMTNASLTETQAMTSKPLAYKIEKANKALF